MINLVGIEGGNEYDQNIVCDFQRTKEIVKECFIWLGPEQILCVLLPSL